MKNIREEMCEYFLQSTRGFPCNHIVHYIDDNTNRDLHFDIKDKLWIDVYRKLKENLMDRIYTGAILFFINEEHCIEENFSETFFN